MAHDQSFFSQARNVGTIYLDREGDYLADVRFCLARHGEDASAVISRFWEEQPSSGFTVVPLFAHGLPPRRQLSTRQSIEAALASVSGSGHDGPRHYSKRKQHDPKDLPWRSWLSKGKSTRKPPLAMLPPMPGLFTGHITQLTRTTIIAQLRARSGTRYSARLEIFRAQVPKVR